MESLRRGFSISLWLRIKGSRAEGYGILDSISSTASNSLTGIALHTLGQGRPGALEFLFYHRDAKYRFKGRKKLTMAYGTKLPLRRAVTLSRSTWTVSLTPQPPAYLDGLVSVSLPLFWGNFSILAFHPEQWTTFDSINAP